MVSNTYQLSGSKVLKVRFISLNNVLQSRKGVAPRAVNACRIHQRNKSNAIDHREFHGLSTFELNVNVLETQISILE